MVQHSSSSSTPASPSPLIQRYLDDLAVQNPNTAKVVGYYLEDFVQYVKDTYHQDAASDMVVDQIIKDVKSGKADVYDLLRGYVHYLDARKLKPKKISPATLIQKVKVAKRLLEYYDIDISSSKFKMKVKMPRSVQCQKSPLLQDAERPQEWLNETGRLEFDNLQVSGRLWQLRPRISKCFHPRTQNRMQMSLS